jgi:hypothetical protein
MNTESLRMGSAAGLDGPPKRNLRALALDEAKSFIGIFLYLFVVFGLLTLHEWLVLSSQHLSFRFYGFALINALVLAKIILIAENLKFAEKYKNKPLVYPVLYKSLAFTALLLLAYILEEIVVGKFHGKSVAEGMPQVAGGTLGGWPVVAIIMCAALMPFFAFRELGRVIGQAQFNALCFTGRLKAPR